VVKLQGRSSTPFMTQVITLRGRAGAAPEALASFGSPNWAEASHGE
jgi:hypothetical protein